LESDWRYNRELFGQGGLLDTPFSSSWEVLDYVAELDPPVVMSGGLKTHLFAFPPSGTTRIWGGGRLITPVGVPDGYLVMEAYFVRPAGDRFPFGFGVKPDTPPV